MVICPHPDHFDKVHLFPVRWAPPVRRILLGPVLVVPVLIMGCGIHVFGIIYPKSFRHPSQSAPKYIVVLKFTLRIDGISPVLTRFRYREIDREFRHRIAGKILYPQFVIGLSPHLHNRLRIARVVGSIHAVHFLLFLGGRRYGELLCRQDRNRIHPANPFSLRIASQKLVFILKQPDVMALARAVFHGVVGICIVFHPHQIRIRPIGIGDLRLVIVGDPGAVVLGICRKRRVLKRRLRQDIAPHYSGIVLPLVIGNLRKIQFIDLRLRIVFKQLF